MYEEYWSEPESIDAIITGPIEYLPKIDPNLVSSRHNRITTNTTTTTRLPTTKMMQQQILVSTIPTPPSSPPLQNGAVTSHDTGLDELLETIPEILDQPIERKTNYNDILIDLESKDHMLTRMINPSTMELCDKSWNQNSTPMFKFELAETKSVIVESIHGNRNEVIKDIMWGGGCIKEEEPITSKRKQRNLSESSVDSVAELHRYFNYDDHLPATPQDTSSDSDDNVSIESGYESSPVQAVKSEHDYSVSLSTETTRTLPGGGCGGISLMDTDDEVDPITVPSRPSVVPNFVHAHTNPNVTIVSASSAIRSQDVKTRLHNHVTEVIRNKQKVIKPYTAPSTSSQSPTHIVYSKATVKRLGKPEAYTKRMMSTHAEALSSTKKTSTTVISGKNKKAATGRHEDDEGRRTVHNSLERLRRVELRNSFNNLRLLVPETANSEKAPKVMILKKGAAYCQLLANQEREFLHELQIQTQKNTALQNRLKLLRQSR